MAANSIIKDTVKRIFPNSKVLLFGSQARGDFKENSDYDLLVIIEEELSPSDKMPYRTIIRKNLLSHDIFSDVLIQSKTEVAQKKNLKGHVIRNIMKEGIEL